MQGAEIIVKNLERMGVKYIFGIPGDTTHFFRALKESSIDFITARDERSAGFTADVFARISGRPSVLYISRGPGIANAVTGIASAFFDGSPVLVIADQVSRKNCFRRTHMYVKAEDLLKPVSKGVDVVWNAKDISASMSRAWTEIQKKPNGPWCLIFPADVLNEGARFSFFSPLKANSRDDSERAVRRLKHFLERKKHPIFILGPGTIECARSGELKKFIEHFSVPFFTTRLAKGVIEENHHLSYGALETREQKRICRWVFGKADLVVTIGYDCADKVRPVTWNQWGHKKTHLDISHLVEPKPGWFSSDEECVVDIKNFLRLARGRIAKPPYFDRLAAPSKIQETRDVLLKKRFGGHLLFDMLKKPFLGSLSSKDILISDTGFHKWYMEAVYEAPGPNIIFSVGLSSIGFSVPAAIGAALAKPKSKIISITGDGGFLMSSSELETIKRLRLPIKIIVVADNSYGLIRRRQLEHFGGEVSVNFTNPNFKKFAEAFGFAYLAVYTKKDLRFFNKIINNRSPALIVIHQRYNFKRDIRLKKLLHGNFSR